MRDTLDESIRIFGTLMPQLTEQDTAEFQQRLQAKENVTQAIADTYFDDPQSDIRKAVEAALAQPDAVMPFGMQR